MSTMNKCIIIPDSFKGTLSAMEVCAVMKKNVSKYFPESEIIAIPIADGGEGTVDCFRYILNCEKVEVDTTGPYNEKISAYYARTENTAITEIASVAGLPQVEKCKNPCKTTTYGLGEIIKHAIQSGCDDIVIGLGGSCTNDGGIGVAAALGTKFFRVDGKQFLPNASEMTMIDHIDMTETRKLLSHCKVTGMCDIDNPLYGKTGAAHVFAPQKGANHTMVELLDQNLVVLSNVIKKTLEKDISNIPGAGAAGGLGAGIVAFLGGELKSGISTILDLVEFDRILKDTDMVFTGEGRIDGQSLRGKVVSGVAERAKKQGIPVTVIAGAIEDDAEEIFNKGVTSLFSINRKAVDFSISKKYSCENLDKTMDSILRFYKSI